MEMDNKLIRENNLRLLIKKAGSANVLAQKVNTDAAYLSQILSKKTDASVGDKLARRLEKAMDCPYGWMDFVHEEEWVEQEKINLPGATVYEAILKELQIISSPEIESYKQGKKVKGAPLPVCLPAQLQQEKLIIIVAEGDAMECDKESESIHNGDLMIVNLEGKPEIDDIVVFVIDNTPLYRILGKDGGMLILKPLNPRYPIIPVNDKIKIIGTVVMVEKPNPKWRWRKPSE